MSEFSSIGNEFEIDDNSIEPDDPSATRPLFQQPPQSQVVADGQRMEQRGFTGGDTLDEPVLTTLLRDVKSFGHLLLQTVGWRQEEVTSREWDLWGPLMFSLLISLVISLESASNKSGTFSILFSLIWLGMAAVISNIKFLGGTISYLHALCITGYSLFPLLVAAALTHVVKLKLVRTVTNIALCSWAIFSARRGLKFAGVNPRRIALAAYPLALFYVCLGWLCVLA